MKPFLLRGGHRRRSARTARSSPTSTTAGRWTASSPPTSGRGATEPRRWATTTAGPALLLERRQRLRALRPVLLVDPYGIRNNRSTGCRPSPRPAAPADPAGGYGDQLTIFDRLQAAGVSWKFYVQDYDRTQTYQSASPANPETQTARVPLRQLRPVHRRPGARQPHRRPRPVLQGPAGRDVARGRLHGIRVRLDERSARSISARPEPGPEDGHAADAQPVLGQLRVHVVLRRTGRLVRPRAAAERARPPWVSGFRPCWSARTRARARSTTRSWTTPAR